MGFIRSGVVFFLGIILFLTIFMGNGFLTLSWSLEHDTVKPYVSETFNSYINDTELTEVLNQNYEFMTIYCISYSEFNLTFENMSMSIPCEVINQGPDYVISYGFDNYFDELYYGDYSCTFWQCLKESKYPFVLISEKARLHWKSLFHWSVLVFLAIMALMFLIAESKRFPIILAGVLMFIASLPYRKIDWLFSFLPSSEFANLVYAFFSKSYNVFITMSIVAGILFFTGIALHLFKFGFKFSKLVSSMFKKKKDLVEKSEVEKIVKEEIKKEKNLSNSKKKKKD